MILYVFVAILCGVTIVVSRIINSSLGDKIGVFQSTFYNYLTGLIFSALILLFAKENLLDSKDVFSNIPFTAYIGGIIGVASITLSNYIAPKISAFYMALLIFIGQLFVGIIIDYFSLNIFSMGKLVGGIIVCIGLAFNLMVDKKEEDSQFKTILD